LLNDLADSFGDVVHVSMALGPNLELRLEDD
jgi:hypothetical protein